MRTPVPDAPDLLTSDEAENTSVLPAAKRYKLSNAAVHGLNTEAKMMVDAFEAEANNEAAVKKAWWNFNCPGYSHHCRAIGELVVARISAPPHG
ncbi:unnamed protein product [Tilletia controversa]|uniref:Uncharacterized protein n=2 Tax=Tilletia TaxID=13289 RepID=A0A8X7MKY7_9BASI|nr:hypothetical protein CF335_g5969 [Tilletia laevis]KAE8239717.1 hypothetical protein A4X06_0g8081 [Tilletia controversa]KAE8253437.1 hypothetical protein A4X03_0g5895 [Tilletia caries]CAD6933609.1 unnamed protein product [Tilletia controversa]CAD6940697.1 unnamed protein product [Tilletia controversa]